jgi:Ni/Co efflux regulator RcnB
MKKLMTLMLALSFLAGTTALFAQGDKDKDAKADSKTKKGKKGKKGKDAKPADEKKS